MDNLIKLNKNLRYNNLFYINLINKITKNLLILFNKTEINKRNEILSVLSDILPKKFIIKQGFIFSDTMYRTAKRKNCESENNETENNNNSKKIKQEEEQLIINKLKENSEKSSKLYRNNLVYNLQESKLFIYNKIKKENPNIGLSLSKFYKSCPKNFQYIKKKTDMCDICINGKKLEKKNDTKNEKYIYYQNHRDLNRNQKLKFKEKVNELKERECFVIMDFKENFKIGGGPVESSQIFYNKSQISCLGFCIIYKENNVVKRKYVDYLSKIITHDSYYVIQCIQSLHKKYLKNYDTVHFWSDNAGHFRSSELMNHILLELPGKKLSTSMNFFVEYHGKSDVDGHFGVLQKAFKICENKQDILSLDHLLYCFKDHFSKLSTDVTFEVYKENRRKAMIKKVAIKQPKTYLSLLSKNGHIIGSSLSTFEDSKYRNVDFKVVYKKETRKSKYAPEIQNREKWDLSLGKMRVMGNRIALET